MGFWFLIGSWLWSGQNNESPDAGLSSSPQNRLAVGDVHRHFEAEPHFGEFRLGPHSLLQK
jgi:hypothetical protein